MMYRNTLSKTQNLFEWIKTIDDYETLKLFYEVWQGKETINKDTGHGEIIIRIVNYKNMQVDTTTKKRL